MAWLDTFGRGGRGKGLLLVTMAAAVVRLWAVSTHADTSEAAATPVGTAAAAGQRAASLRLCVLFRLRFTCITPVLVKKC
eukprot:COSAG01_NODE_744_length_13876_cov_4.660449_20_plen_80_part_00